MMSAETIVELFNRLETHCEEMAEMCRLMADVAEGDNAAFNLGAASAYMAVAGGFRGAREDLESMEEAA